MGSADRIERERLAKRALILDAARALFSERGFESVTLREVAQRIEYSTTAIYVQFKDKQDLVEQMVRDDLIAFETALAKKAEIADPVERLDALGTAYLEFALALPQHYRLLFMTPRPQHKTPPAQDDAIPPGVRGYLLLESTIDECIRTGRLRPEYTDASALAQVMWANVHGLASLMIVKPGSPFFEWRDQKVLRNLQRFAIMSGLLAAPDPRFARPTRQPARRPAKPSLGKRSRSP